MSRTKTFGANLPVPQSREEAAAMVKAVGDLGREVTRLETEMNDEIAAIKQRYETAAAPQKEAHAEKVEGLRIWAEANRQHLTGGDKTKTVDLGTGILKWRLRPPAVRLTKIEDVLARLKTLGLHRFIRTKEEVNKEAMQAEPDVARQVAGVSISSAGEDFIVEPFEAELAAPPVQA